MLPLRTSRDGRVVVATFENPPHQLLDAAGVAALADLVAEVERDEGVGAVVLTGAHPERFLAHYDIAALRESAQTPGGVALSPPVAGAALRATGLLRRIPVAGEALTRTPASGLVELQRFHDALLGMQRSPATWIAALNGSAQGGGFEIALACDLRLAADDDALLLGVPEVALGFAPTAGSSQRLPRLIGASLAIELVLEGRPLSPRGPRRLLRARRRGPRRRR
jgi:enoyl-CoA hydratase